jgi:hypothetical protein
MTDLYPDTPCPACDRRHTLAHRNTDRRPPRSIFSYVCPLTKVVVSFRAAVTPDPVILAPAEAISMTWISD